MQDSRLNTIAALIDDSRELIEDMREEGVPAEDRISLERARRHLNIALDQVHALKALG